MKVFPHQMVIFVLAPRGPCRENGFIDFPLFFQHILAPMGPCRESNIADPLFFHTIRLLPRVPAVKHVFHPLISVFFHESPSISSFFDETWCIFSSRRDASVCKASARSELTEGRFQCFFTNRLQFRPFSTKLVLSTSSRRDASVCKASAQSEPIDPTNLKKITSEKKNKINKKSIIILNHHQSSSVIISHHQSSSVIISHHQSSSVIISHHQSLSFIINHHQSSSIIMHQHHSSSFIMNYHETS